MFKWPNVFDIWNTYLTKFIARYGGKKLERARDLFEQALDGCPEKNAKSRHVIDDCVELFSCESWGRVLLKACLAGTVVENTISATYFA